MGSSICDFCGSLYFGRRPQGQYQGGWVKCVLICHVMISRCSASLWDVSNGIFPLWDRLSHAVSAWKFSTNIDHGLCGKALSEQMNSIGRTAFIQRSVPCRWVVPGKHATEIGCIHRLHLRLTHNTKQSTFKFHNSKQNNFYIDVVFSCICFRVGITFADRTLGYAAPSSSWQRSYWWTTTDLEPSTFSRNPNSSTLLLSINENVFEL